MRVIAYLATTLLYGSLLAACGGGSGGSSDTVATPPTPDPEPITADFVTAQFGSQSLATNITFAAPNGAALQMDIFGPSNDNSTSRPLIVLASGGGFLAQDRNSVRPIAEEFARRGYVAATMDYRVATFADLATAASSADVLAVAATRATHDMLAAVRFLRASASGANSYGINGDLIFVGGESAGAVMSLAAATFDPDDAITNQAMADYLAANSGVYGTVGDHDTISSIVQGALPLSGAVISLASLDDTDAPIYAAHEELDPVVPCYTGPEGSSNTGLVVSGSCDIIPTLTARGATGELYLVAGDNGHVSFSDAERDEIYAGAAQFFYDEVINP